jgi:hypothetical protein
MQKSYDKSRMRESRLSGSVEGVLCKHDSYFGWFEKIYLSTACAYSMRTLSRFKSTRNGCWGSHSTRARVLLHSLIYFASGFRISSR